VLQVALDGRAAAGSHCCCCMCGRRVGCDVGAMSEIYGSRCRTRRNMRIIAGAALLGMDLVRPASVTHVSARRRHPLVAHSSIFPLGVRSDFGLDGRRLGMRGRLVRDTRGLVLDRVSLTVRLTARRFLLDVTCSSLRQAWFKCDRMTSWWNGGVRLWWRGWSTASRRGVGLDRGASCLPRVLGWNSGTSLWPGGGSTSCTGFNSRPAP
jgi:hypothetical protein